MPIDDSRLRSSPLFKHFWTGHHPGLSHEGLDEVSRAGAEELARFAREHEANGAVSATEQQVIDAEERELMSTILEDRFYGSLFEIDARPIVTSKFGIDTGLLDLPVVAVRPSATPAMALPERVSRFSAETLANNDIMSLADGFAREYEMRRSYFEDPLLEPAEKGKRVFGLFRDYAKALWAEGQQSNTRQAGQALLTRYWSTPYAAEVGGKDFNGTGIAAAQGVVLNFDPFEFKHVFPEANNTNPFTYLAMDSAMAPAMKYVDDYLKAKGVENPEAEAYEKRPVLGYLLGVPSGHTKYGSLVERKPFSTSGLNWGMVLFPGDTEVAALPPQAGFEFPLDVVDGYRDMVHAGYRPRIEMKDKDGNVLTVEKQIQKDAQGKAVSWSAIFKTADGLVVPPDDAYGRIIDPTGNAKGDGKFDGIADMGWWGFCDRNTAQQVYKARFKIPNLDREVIKVKAGSKTVSIPKAEAQKLVDVDVSDLASDTFIGFRFNGDAQTLRTKGGRTYTGKIPEDVLRFGPGLRRVGGDNVVITNTAEQPIVGSLKVEDGLPYPYFDVRFIDTITQLEDGTVKLQLKKFDRYGRINVTGKLFDALPFEKGTLVDGRRVLKQDDQFSIRGSVTVESASGHSERIPAEEVESIATEAKIEMRFSEYLAHIARNEGMYATDSSPEPLVSNGMRWVNKLELDEKTDGTRPGWVGDRPLIGLEGELKLQAGDKVVYGRGLFKHGYSLQPAASFTGWYQVRDGRVVNEGFITNEPDFAWGPSDTLNWLAPSSFNPHMDPELRVSLMVNGITNMNDELANRLQLPKDWKKYKVEQ